VFVYAQPAIDQPWNAPPIGTTTTTGGRLCYDMFGIVGPIGPGQSFIVYFQNRNGVTKATIPESELPFYLEITTPPGLVANVAWCIVYYPPNHRLSNWLFQGINLGPSGTYRLGPYATSPGDPSGTYALRVGLISRDATGRVYWSTQISFLTIQMGFLPPRCIIATATYGSELTPEVQFLRNFRDKLVLSTFAGRTFMSVFDTWYYSFSPGAADFVSSHPMIMAVMRAVLYLPIGILHLSSQAYSVFSFNPEISVIMTGLMGSSLIGVVCLFPLTILHTFSVAKRRTPPS